MAARRTQDPAANFCPADNDISAFAPRGSLPVAGRDFIPTSRELSVANCIGPVMACLVGVVIGFSLAGMALQGGQ